MTISIGNDHAGVEYKFAIIKHLKSKGYSSAKKAGWELSVSGLVLTSAALRHRKAVKVWAGAIVWSMNNYLTRTIDRVCLYNGNALLLTNQTSPRRDQWTRPEICITIMNAACGDASHGNIT
mgnify:CR=1 FL=1